MTRSELRYHSMLQPSVDQEVADELENGGILLQEWGRLGFSFAKYSSFLRPNMYVQCPVHAIG